MSRIGEIFRWVVLILGKRYWRDGNVDAYLHGIEQLGCWNIAIFQRYEDELEGL